MKNQNPISAIREMLAMQNTLNEKTNGSLWRSGVTQLGKTINWKRCIVMEAAELIDSYPWKHWKSVDGVTDIENVRVELVDIWHFLLSLALEQLELEKAADLLGKTWLANHESTTISSEMTVIEQVSVHEAMMRIALESGAHSEEHLSRLADSFFSACKVAELSFVQMYQIYMAKNVLNEFRQNHGYKEGTYIKVWNGKEDNVVMFEIIATMTDFSGEELYIGLKESYGEISASI